MQMISPRCPSTTSVLSRDLRRTGNSEYGPYFIHVISSGNILYVPRTHSITYFKREAGLIKNVCMKREV